MQQLVGMQDPFISRPASPLGPTHGLGCRCFTVRHVDQAKVVMSMPAASAVFRIWSSANQVRRDHRHVPLHRPKPSALAFARRATEVGMGFAAGRLADQEARNAGERLTWTSGSSDPWRRTFSVGARNMSVPVMTAWTFWLGNDNQHQMPCRVVSPLP